MTLDEVWSRAREIMRPNCRVCKVCNGAACRGEIPGLGAMGDGSSWTNCVEFLSRVKINMDTVYESRGQDASLEIFGRRFRYPIFAAPIGGMSHNYNGAMTDRDWTFALVRGAKAAGILPFSGDNANGEQYACGLDAARENEGLNVVTLKPWADNEKLISRAKELEAAGCIAFACDVDAAGFANMGSAVSQLAPKSEAELRELTGSVKIIPPPLFFMISMLLIASVTASALSFGSTIRSISFSGISGAPKNFTSSSVLVPCALITVPPPAPAFLAAAMISSLYPSSQITSTSTHLQFILSSISDSMTIAMPFAFA